MRQFDNKLNNAYVRQQSVLTNIVTNSDGHLVTTMSDSKHEELMEVFLSGLKTEFRIEDSIKNSFPYEYNKDNLSFTIKPVDASIERILSAFADNNLLPSRERSGRHSPR